MCVCGLAVFADRAAVICARVMQAEIHLSLYVSSSLRLVHACCIGISNEDVESAFAEENIVCRNDTHSAVTV